MHCAGSSPSDYDIVYRLTPLGGGLIKRKYGPVPADAQSVHRKRIIPERQWNDSKIYDPPKRMQSPYKVNYRGVCIWVIAFALIAFGGALETRFGVDPIVWIGAALAVLGLTGLDTAVKAIRERRT